MHKIIDTTPRLFTPEQAERAVAELQADDDEWIYRVDRGTPYCRVEVLDEDGEHVAFVS